MRANHPRAIRPVLPEFRIRHTRAGRPTAADLNLRNAARGITRAIGRRNQVKL